MTADTMLSRRASRMLTLVLSAFFIIVVSAGIYLAVSAQFVAPLRSIGSDVRALFSLEVGKRREGEDEEKQNRRLAGGFAVSF